MALPASLATNRPLKLGDTFLGTGGDEGYYNLKLDFQPESLQQAQQADLLLLGEDKLKLIPLLPEGDCQFHFDGSLEQLQQRTGGDIECVAYFDGNEWTLQLVQANLRAKHRQGKTVVPGYNDNDDDDAAVVVAAAAAAAAQQQAPRVAALQQQMQASSIHQQHEIDPDLDDALEEALFASDKPSSQAQHSDPQQQHDPSAAAAAAASAGRGMGPEAHSRPLQQPAQQQQQQHPRPQVSPQQQQQPLPVQQQAPQAVVQPVAPAAGDDHSESADDDSDDPWNTFDAAAAPAPVPAAAAAAAAASKPAALPVPGHNRHMSAVSGASGGAVQRSTTPQPAAAVPPAPAVQAAPAAVQPVAAGGSGVSRGAVSVLGGDEEDEEEAGLQDMPDGSEDESDGVGVEYL